MGQGVMRASTRVLQELTEVSALKEMDLQALKAKLLLPDAYCIDEIRQDSTALVGGYADVLLSAPDIPDGATITPYYTSAVLDGQHTPELTRIEIAAQPVQA